MSQEFFQDFRPIFRPHFLHNSASDWFWRKQLYRMGPRLNDSIWITDRWGSALKPRWLSRIWYTFTTYLIDRDDTSGPAWIAIDITALCRYPSRWKIPPISLGCGRCRWDYEIGLTCPIFVKNIWHPHRSTALVSLLSVGRLLRAQGPR